jgi:serine/threonine protein kinase
MIMPEKIQLPAMHPEDSVVVLIERLREGLRFPTDDLFSDEYCRSRAILRSHPLLKNHIPEFLTASRTLPDYRKYMQERHAQAFEWDALSGNALAQLQERIKSGSSLDAYEIKGELGWGGFGRVYLAHHNFLDRPFAIKFFQPVFHQGGGTALSRFFQEASMLYDLHHPNIITVRDVGLYQERPFIVMDYFDGMTLNSALSRHGAMSPGKAIQMIGMLAEATKHAHGRNIVHRDLKPSNIMLKPNECRVIDFGLGVYVEQLLNSRLTATGEAPAGGSYTARELLANPRLVDPRSDIYSIGAIWYTAVTNDVPAGANLADSLHPVANLPASHRDIILRCLSDVQYRFASCDDLLTAIKQASDQEKTQ